MIFLKMPRTFVSLVNILEIHLLPEVAQGFGSTDECRRAQKIFCNYVAAADETELEVIKDINAQYQVKIYNIKKEDALRLMENVVGDFYVIAFVKITFICLFL